jgi:hypothetical protein
MPNSFVLLPKFSDAEYERAHAAYDEFKSKGRADLTCMKCGTGHFQFIETRSGLEIRCETLNCFVERIRGI